MAKLAQIRFAIEFVKETREIDAAIGGVKLWEMYKKKFGNTSAFGRDSFTRVLAENGLTLRVKKRTTRTTNSDHNYPKYPDLVKNLLLTHKNEVWVSDITYIPMAGDEGKFSFLSIITDAFTKEIVGYYVGETLETTHTIQALNMALESLPIDGQRNLIHHSDRGIQYASYLYVNKLNAFGLKISMTETSDPKDNAIAERVNGIIKNEFLNHLELKTIEDVRKAVDRAIEFYNDERPHRSLGMMTPREAAKNPKLIKKLWKSFKEKYCLESA